MPGLFQETTSAAAVACTSRCLRLGAFGILTLLLAMQAGSEGLAWFPRAAAAPLGTYDIKLSQAKTGDKGLVVRDENATATTVMKDADGKVVWDKTEKTVGSYKFSEEILKEEGDKSPTRLRRTYEKAQITKDGTTTILAYEGKTVLIEKKGPKFTFSIEGGKQLTVEEAAKLSEEFDIPESKVEPTLPFLPSKAVLLGETWKIDMEAIFKGVGSEKPAVDIAKSKGSGKLVKVYRKDGKTFGVIEIKMDMVMSALGGAFKEGGRTSYVITMDVCIDGTSCACMSTGTTTFKGSTTIKGFDGKDWTLDLETTSHLTSRNEERPR